LSRPVRVFLAGEGKAELGSRAGHPAYQSDEQPGVIATLLGRVQPDGWEIGGVREWKTIRKLKVGAARHADTHNVLGVALDAKEAGCAALAFMRDRDNDPDREAAIEQGIERAGTELDQPPQIIGGVAIPTLEGWLLALLGRTGTEQMSPGGASDRLARQLDGTPSVEAMVGLVESADLKTLPPDSRSLTVWLNRAKGVLPALVESADGAS